MVLVTSRWPIYQKVELSKSLRANASKYEEYDDRSKISDFLLFHLKDPFGEPFFENYIKTFYRAFIFMKNRKIKNTCRRPLDPPEKQRKIMQLEEGTDVVIHWNIQDFAARREKNEETYCAVKNSDTLNRRFTSGPVDLLISRATASPSSFLPVVWPMLNLASRYAFCVSLKRYDFFVSFKAYPSSTMETGSSHFSGSRDFRVGVFPTPSSKRDAYCVFATSNSDCRSRDLEHLSNERCRSRDENRWKTRTQPSLGQEKAFMTGLASLAVSSASCEKGLSRRDLVAKGLNPPVEKSTLSHL